MRALNRYYSYRTFPLDYKTAIEKGFPIGSFDIVRFHRYKIQERLKLPGVRLLAANADA